MVHIQKEVLQKLFYYVFDANFNTFSCVLIVLHNNYVDNKFFFQFQVSMIDADLFF